MSKQDPLSDDDILLRLTGPATDGDRKEALRQVYLDNDLRAMVFAHVRRHNGNSNDVEEVFQETMLVFERSLREGRFDGRSTWRTYFVGIAKWHWLNTRRKTNRQTEWKAEEYPDEAAEAADAQVLDEEARAVLDGAIATLGARCQEILRLWLLAYSPQELSDRFGLTGPEMAKKESYRCRDRLKAYFDKKPHLRDLLKRR
ncbi:MAG: sigma-70 family RNA polymerase sigma factor [Saprospiraceae bacterium]